jgi:outer membrane protein assembly factor BamD
MTYDLLHSRVRQLPALVALLLLVTGCGMPKNVVPAGTTAPDEFLYMRGTAALMNEKWLDARQYFQQVVDNYPQSPRRPDAKLALGDTYLGEGTPESLVYAANEFREFLQFYPVHTRADYAQYKLAMTHHKQMRAPERDQTETKAALAEFEAFFERYPNSPLTPEVRMRWREARDRLSEAGYRVGLYYYRVKWYVGAIDRFKEVLKDDPAYTGRDAVYFYLADSLVKSSTPNSDKRPEALPYFDRLLMEFPMCEFAEEAAKRAQELKQALNTQ